MGDIPFSHELLAVDEGSLLSLCSEVLKQTGDFIKERENQSEQSDTAGINANLSDPTVAEVLITALHARCLRVMHGLCLSSDLVSLLLRSPGASGNTIAALFALASDDKYGGFQMPTAALEDQLLGFEMELVKRARVPLPIAITLKAVPGTLAITLEASTLLFIPRLSSISCSSVCR